VWNFANGSFCRAKFKSVPPSHDYVTFSLKPASGYKLQGRGPPIKAVVALIICFRSVEVSVNKRDMYIIYIQMCIFLHM
jgi:hypothetical protein